MTDSKNRTWEILKRDDGSVSVFYTKPDAETQYIVYDSLDSDPDGKVTDEWLKENGFTFDPNSDEGKIFGYVRKTGEVDLVVGTWPNNILCLSIMHNGYTIITRRISRNSVMSAIKLFENCEVDEP